MRLRRPALLLPPTSVGAALAVAVAFGAWGEPPTEGPQVEVDEPAAIRQPALAATVWWSDSLGTALSARVLDGAVESGPRAMLADACAAWRLARGEWGSLDLLGGARIAAASDEVDPVGGVDLGAFRGESQPLAGLRARCALIEGVSATARADLSPRADGPAAGWSVGCGLRAEMDERWNLSVEASVRSLDRALSDALGTAAPGADGAEGAVWIGLSRAF